MLFALGMRSNIRVHLAAAGLLALIAGVIVVFWTYPRLLVYLLLAIVALLAYGALYLILAAWMDPRDAGAAERVSEGSAPASVELAGRPATEEPAKRSKRTRRKRPKRRRKPSKPRSDNET